MILILSCTEYRVAGSIVAWKLKSNVSATNSERSVDFTGSDKLTKLFTFYWITL